ncbi:capsular biosynthesis protein [Campylobacter vulpis]|uniref:capsular biosynthesis protein n=1 Tax=Campylobacter vulpis TaxID=1655500 RepID=UPI001BCD7FB3|nr:capsular biosynthesis protein [Campylobacter vulpis]MBS4313697.1 capsular biosynthesis protein [Campylobacter vulpis]
MKNPKIALCISGALRHDYCEDLKQIAQKVATPLNADIFLFSWKEACLWAGAGGLGVGFLRNFIDENLLKNAPNELLIDNYHFSKLFPNTFSLIEQEYTTKISKKSLHFIKNLPHFKALILENQEEFIQHYPRLLPIHNSSKMFYGFSRVLDLLFEYERKMKERYDFIIMIRPDKHYIVDINPDEFKNLGTKDIVLETSQDGEQLGDVYAFGKRFAMVEFLSTFTKANGGLREEFFQYFPSGINCASYGCLDHAMLRRYVDFIGLNVIAGQKFIKWQSASKATHFPNVREALKRDLKNLSQNYPKEKLKEFKSFFESLNSYLKPLKTNKKYLYYNKTLADERIKATLTYRLGFELVQTYKNKRLSDLLTLPYRLMQIKKLHKIEKENYQKAIKINPKLSLLPLEHCADYDRALQMKNHLSYKVGESFLKACNTGGGGGGSVFSSKSCLA